jgi:hypothetical protein
MFFFMPQAVVHHPRASCRVPPADDRLALRRVSSGMRSKILRCLNFGPAAITARPCGPYAVAPAASRLPEAIGSKNVFYFAAAIA